MFEINRIIDTDSYKASHWLQYPPNTTRAFFYLESRGSDRDWNESVFFGLQYLLKNYFLAPFTREMVEEAREVITAHGLLFNYEGWTNLITKHKGKLPLRVRAVPEGMVVPLKNALMTVETTDDEFAWLGSWFETQLMRIWYGITVATQSWQIKKDVYRFLQETADDADAEIAFKVHDFGARGVSSQETAAIGGAAHLVNFMGTDTMAALLLHRKFYHAPMAGFSIPAAEHSTITAWGRENEVLAYLNMLRQFAKPNALVAVVSDSWDIYNAVEKIWGEQLRQEVIDSGATVVIRPDCYDEETEFLTENGWKKFADLGEYKVAQFNDNFTTAFVVPLEKFEMDYKGEMIHFTDRHGRLDLLVTPNHRMVLADKNKSLFITEAKGAKFRDNRCIPRTALSNRKGGGLNPFERFLIAFQADGSFPSGFSKINNPGILCGHIKARFNFTKNRKVKRLVEICKTAKLDYLVCREGKRVNNISIYVNISTDRLLSKLFSDWVNPSTRSLQWCQEFIDELSHWDATVRNNSKTEKIRIKYDTSVESNADIVQQIAIFSGYGCTYSIRKDERKDIFSDIYSLTLTERTLVNGQAIAVKAEQYQGKIYCLKVPSGMLIVRRNKKAVVCGNSGEPVEVVSRVAKILGEKFGAETNSKGYKVLNNVRIIQGDGVNEQSIHDILQRLKSENFSASNIAFGIGGSLLQKIDRDTLKFAYKCSAIVVDGNLRDVYKQPVTDAGKISKRGRLDLIRDEQGEYKTVRLKDAETLQAENSVMRAVFENGELLVDDSLEEIRNRAI